MELWPYIIPFVYIILLESLTVRWVAGGPVPGLVSRILATNLAGYALLMFISLTGWFLGWWPDIRNWALRDSFFLLLLMKWPIFGFLFRRWGFQRVFTLHVLSNFVSAIVLSLLFVYSPLMTGLKPLTVDTLKLNDKAEARVKEIRNAVDAYFLVHEYYPRYLWGGDLVSWEVMSMGQCPDPLLAEGYLTAYPVNPLNLQRSFFEPRRVSGWKELWMGYKSDDYLYVRSLWQGITERNPRFGIHGAKMGNVLPDPAIPATKLPDDVRFAVQGRWFPGGFFYRAYDLNNDTYPDAYILGVCGDESRAATMDCYDARTDSLTREVNGQVMPSAGDRLRDGVIYRINRGFEETPPPEGGPFRPRPLTIGENGENLPTGQISAGMPESLPLSTYGGENVE